MLNPNTAFRKSELGSAEVANRKLGLRAELRRLLILIDGRNTVSKLAAFVRMPEIDGLMNELISQGLIEPADGSAAPVSASPAMTVPTQSVETTEAAAAIPMDGTAAIGVAGLAPTQEQFLAARMAAVRFVNDTLGPSGESLAVKLERVHNAHELRNAVTEVRISIERALDAATAQRFLEHVRSSVK